MASSHTNGNDAFSSSFFEGNNYYANLDPSLVDPHDSTSEQAWSVQPNQLNIARGYQTSEPQQWQDVPTLSTNSATPSYMDQSGQYGGAYNSTSSHFQNHHVAENQFNPYQQSIYDSSTAAPDLSHARFGMATSDLNTTVVPTKTVAPEALQSQPAYRRTNSGTSQHQSHASGPSSFGQVMPRVPQGITSGHFLIVNPQALSAVAVSRHLHNFVNVGDQAYDVTITKSTIPSYVPRKSRNEIKQLLAVDSKLSAKAIKKVTKHGSVYAPRNSLRKNISENGSTRRSVSVSARSSSDEDSSDDSDYESSDDDAEKTPLPALRPSGATEAVRYDCVKALWRPRGRPASGDDIRDGLKDFWELFQTIRDRWKSDSAAVKQAEDSKKNHEVPLLKERVAKQRQLAGVSLRAAMDQGHPDIVEHFGEYLPFMAALAAFLMERTRESDYSGDFSHTVLEFISRCKTLTEGNLEKTNIAKILQRFAKRGDKIAQSLAKRITDNAAAASRKRKDANKSPAPNVKSKDAKEVSNAAKVASISAGVKRRVGDAASEQPLKKVASSTNGTVISTNKSGAAVKKFVPDSKAPAAAAAAVPKQVMAKPTSFFSGLQSAAKKPGTSNAAVAAAAQAKASAQDRVVEKKPSVAAAPPAAFSFAATMANLTKPKDVETVVKREEPGPPETAEEKAKRIRKEERRKLRVSWRPDESLVAVKYFMHDPEEELGHDASQVRDVGDIGSEGRMLKEHRDMMDIEDEEEEIHKPADRAWHDPSLIDFSVITEADKDRNYAPYGGGVQIPASAEREVQERREANTLMAFYSSRFDIPATPKEAPPEADSASVEVKEFGPFPEQLVERLKSLAGKQATKTARITAFDPAKLSALISSFGNQSSGQQPSATQASGLAQQQQSIANLESLFAKHATQAALAGGGQHNQKQSQEPNSGMPFQATQSSEQPSPALSNAAALSSLLATLASHNSQPQESIYRPPSAQSMRSPSAQPMRPPSVQSMGPSMGVTPPVYHMPQFADGAPNYSAQQYVWMQQNMLKEQLYQASLQQQYPMPHQQQYQASLQQQYPTPHQQQYQTPHQQQYQLPQQPQQGHPYENEERRRWREGGGAGVGGGFGSTGSTDNTNETEEPNGFGKRQQRMQGSGGVQKKRVIGGQNQLPMFVIQCKYFNEGKCRKGAECTFRHDPVQK